MQMALANWRDIERKGGNNAMVGLTIVRIQERIFAAILTFLEGLRGFLQIGVLIKFDLTEST